MRRNDPAWMDHGGVVDGVQPRAAVDVIADGLVVLQEDVVAVLAIQRVQAQAAAQDVVAGDAVVQAGAVQILDILDMVDAEQVQGRPLLDRALLKIGMDARVAHAFEALLGRLVHVVLHGIDARAAIELVAPYPQVLQEYVVAGAADDRVLALAANQGVVAGAAIQPVVARPAG
ncbi:Uncharacterised protein [Bordetella pertussis]|nr:Uncharacterised protein [Bordetella pertussis]